jgi:small subunit ribosomal protein S20
LARALSSQKRLRQNRKRAALNTTRKTRLKGAVRAVRDALAGKDVAAAQAAFRETVRILDRSANRMTIHRNTAARRKSRLARRLNAMAATPKK